MLIGAVVCLQAAVASPIAVNACNGWPHLRCSTIGSCQSTITSEIVKRGWTGCLPFNTLNTLITRKTLFSPSLARKGKCYGPRNVRVVLNNPPKHWRTELLMTRDQLVREP